MARRTNSSRGPDPARMEQAVRGFLRAIGDAGHGEETAGTPERVARAWCREILSGYRQDPARILRPLRAPADGGIVVVRDIDFFSVCVHHLLPFFGRAHLAYEPRDVLVGVSKLARLVNCRSRRLQIQESLTRQIVGDLMRCLGAAGAACVLEARHLCMVIRGAEKKESRVVTTFLAGGFEAPGRREEVLRLLSG